MASQLHIFLGMRWSRFFSFRRRTAHVVVDIGSSSVKLARVAHAPEGPSLAHTRVVSLPPGSVLNGWVRDPISVADAIGTFVRANGLKSSPAVTAVPGRAVMVKMLELPGVDTVDLETTIEFEAMQVIPESLDDVYIDYHVTGETGGKKLNVILTAVKKEWVRSYMDVLAQAGLDPKVVEVDYFALQNLCHYLHPDTRDQVVCIVQMGASASSVNIMSHGSPVFSSELETAGRALTRRMARNGGAFFEKAEALKLDDPLRSGTGDVADLVQSFCSEFAGAVEGQMSLFAAMHGAPGVDRIYLCGGVAGLPGLQATLAAKLHKRFARPEPLWGPAHTACGPMQGLPLEFAVAGGLALQPLEPKPA